MISSNNKNLNPIGNVLVAAIAVISDQRGPEFGPRRGSRSPIADENLNLSNVMPVSCPPVPAGWSQAKESKERRTSVERQPELQIELYK